MNYPALFLCLFCAIAIGMPVGQVLSILADAGLRMYMDYLDEKNAPEEDDVPEQDSITMEEIRKHPIGPRTKRIDPAGERTMRSMP